MMPMLIAIDDLADLHKNTTEGIAEMFLTLFAQKKTMLLLKANLVGGEEEFQKIYPRAEIANLFEGQLLASYPFCLQLYERSHVYANELFTVPKINAFCQKILETFKVPESACAMLKMCFPEFDEIQVHIHESVSSLVRDQNVFLTDVELPIKLHETVEHKLIDLAGKKYTLMAEDLILLAFLHEDLDLNYLKLSLVNVETFIFKIRQKFFSFVEGVRSIFLMAEGHYYQCNGVFPKMLEKLGKELAEKNLHLNLKEVDLLLASSKVQDYLKDSFAKKLQQNLIDYHAIFGSQAPEDMKPTSLIRILLADVKQEDKILQLQEFLMRAVVSSDLKPNIMLTIAQDLLGLSECPVFLEDDAQGDAWWFKIAQKVYAEDSAELQADIDSYILASGLKGESMQKVIAQYMPEPPRQSANSTQAVFYKSSSAQAKDVNCNLQAAF